MTFDKKIYYRPQRRTADTPRLLTPPPPAHATDSATVVYGTHPTGMNSYYIQLSCEGPHPLSAVFVKQLIMFISLSGAIFFDKEARPSSVSQRAAQYQSQVGKSE